MHALYEMTLPVFVRGLGNLDGWLAKAERHAEAAGMPMSELLGSRLAPDMFSFVQQVQYAYFTSLEAAENLSGKSQPELSYSEQTVDELHASIDTALRHLRSIDASGVPTSGDREIETFLLTGRKIDLWTYVRHFALPNFYFHTVTAYGLLRHKGVPLGKGDYIGGKAA